MTPEERERFGKIERMQERNERAIDKHNKAIQSLITVAVHFSIQPLMRHHLDGGTPLNFLSSAPMKSTMILSTRTKKSTKGYIQR